MSIKERLARIRLDPFPQVTHVFGEYLCKPRLVILTAILTKICLDRLYQYSAIVNPNGQLDAEGKPTLDILEYHHPSTADDIYNFLAGYGAKGREAYLSLLFYDNAFLLCRTLPLCLLTYMGFKRAPQYIRPGVWIHLLTTAWDLGENALLYIILKTYPRRLDFVAWLATGFIQGKWVLFWATIFIIFVSVGSAIYYTFHSMLADSVMVLQNDKKDKENARRHVDAVLKRQRALAAASASGKKKQS
ncbi:hypothetical protein LRAMOSA06668 [Lichtheimia ramosa]|uniref:Uncharacterized protein n=1 Tax=Lichtheimia ramosa TaxID=688394 RepID=A0A077X4T8_9FUNG|nr:hypothetical protein LRAMOSA06668 [Lichtheimia ramosa]